MDNRSIMREEASFYQQQAKRYGDKFDWKKEEANYQKSITYLLQIPIPEWEKEDYQQASLLYRTIGNCHFNSANYDNAARYYLKGIEILHTIPCEDKDYRDLIEIYIDLSDTHSHLFNSEAAANAFKNAIIAFRLIGDKNFEERNIGDPEKNPEAFRNFFEKKCSSDRYLESNTFKNNEYLLYQTHQANEEINTINAKFSAALDFSSTNRSSTSAHPFSIFTIPPAVEQLEDDHYRSIAMSLMQLGQKQYQKKQIKDVMDTYKQAAQALNCIKGKNPSDLATLQAIDQGIRTLRDEASINALTQSMNGAFAQNTTARSILQENNSDDMMLDNPSLDNRRGIFGP